MMTAKVFENGRSQAVRLPKECRFATDEVVVNRIGDIVLLMPNTNRWSSFLQAVDLFSDDFMETGRNQGMEEHKGNLTPRKREAQAVPGDSMGTGTLTVI